MSDERSCAMKLCVYQYNACVYIDIYICVCMYVCFYICMYVYVGGWMVK